MQVMLQVMSVNAMVHLVRDVLHSCQAISTEGSVAPQPEDRNFIVNHGLRAASERQLMLKIGELGWLVRYSNFSTHQSMFLSHIGFANCSIS